MSRTAGPSTTATPRRVSRPATRRTRGPISVARSCGAGRRARRAYASRKRPSASDRLAITARPRRTSSRQSSGRGLAVIASRSEALGRFLEAYARLARLPAPRLGPRRSARWCGGGRLETRLGVAIVEGPAYGSWRITIRWSSASSTSCATARMRPSDSGGVCVSWGLVEGGARQLEIRIEARGPVCRTSPSSSSPSHHEAHGLGSRPRAGAADGRSPGGSLVLEHRRDRHAGAAAPGRLISSRGSQLPTVGAPGPRLAIRFSDAENRPLPGKCADGKEVATVSKSGGVDTHCGRRATRNEETSMSVHVDRRLQDGMAVLALLEDVGSTRNLSPLRRPIERP